MYRNRSNKKQINVFDSDSPPHHAHRIIHYLISVVWVFFRQDGNTKKKKRMYTNAFMESIHSVLAKLNENMMGRKTPSDFSVPSASSMARQ